MLKDTLVKKAISQFNWYIHNVSTSRRSAIEYAQQIYDHALYSGSIIEAEHKKLCLELPFKTYLK